jgi:hypothetical protein
MDNRKLGWIAIGLGVLALVFALGGRGRPQGWYNDGPRFSGPMAAGPQWQPGPQGQGQQAGPQWQGPQQAEPRGQGQQEWGVPHEGWRAGRGGDFGHGGPRHFGGWFFFPFMIFGGLFRLALFALLIMLVVRWFRGRNHKGTQDPPSQSPPGPEQPPYTGGTQAL